ncbi:MAG: conserved membrane protein of unknown function [Nitrospira sp.]|nr:MAG: conserved membrane protein of unknown function [Nitrospira sp.]
MEQSKDMANDTSQAAAERNDASLLEEPEDPTRILVPGQTCWRIETAERTAFLVDGEAYFKAFRDAALRATHSIMIVGWDIDTQVELVRDERASSDMPAKLGEFLVALLRRRRKLRVYVLNWDYAVIYALERQWMPTAEPGWRRHRRLSYQMDDHHPVGASHHQKLVVVDDAIGFVGGLDLSKSRWDTREHLSRNSRRIDADGASYAPFHDVQMMVTGDAASALGDLARSRWLRATGRRLPAPARRSVEEVWPPELHADLMECRIGILRTQPRYEELEERREIEQAYLTAIKRARRSIYIESQYFTAQAMSRALAQRLSEHDGPDVVLVLRRHCDGWLERRTMDTLRARLLQEVELADHYGRLRVYAPVVPGEEGAVPVAVHSKLLIVDDEFVCVGSANMSNRSMGFDTECNLAIEAGGQTRLQAAIASLRNGLLAEHLGVVPETVAAQIHTCGSLAGAIDSLRGGERTLADGCFDALSLSDAMIPEHALVDPERPMAADHLLAGMGFRRERVQIARRALWGLSLLAGMAMLAAAWRWTALGQLLDLEALVNHAQALGRSPLGLLAVMGGYVVGGVLAIPVTALLVVTILAFGPWLGGLSALAGSLLSAITLFGFGRAMGAYRIRRFVGSRVELLSRRLAERGFWAVLLVRVLPIAPFSVINLVAGASPLSLRNFVLGTFVGMLPGITLMTTFVGGLEDAVREPSWQAFMMVGMVIAAVWSAVWYISGQLQAGQPAPLAPESSISAT